MQPLAKFVALSNVLLACSSPSRAPADPVCDETIYGADISPTGECRPGPPALKVWVRDHAVFDGQSCTYAVLGYEPGSCDLIQELLVQCGLGDGFSSAVYQVEMDYGAGRFVWGGGVHVPSGITVCAQRGGGPLEAVDPESAAE